MISRSLKWVTLIEEKVEKAGFTWLMLSLLAHGKASIVELLSAHVSGAITTKGWRMVLLRIIEMCLHGLAQLEILLLLLLLLVQVFNVLIFWKISVLTTHSLLVAQI